MKIFFFFGGGTLYFLQDYPKSSSKSAAPAAPHLSYILEPDFGMLLSVDERLVPEQADRVADHQGDHEVHVDAKAVAVQRPGRECRGSGAFNRVCMQILSQFKAV